MTWKVDPEQFLTQETIPESKETMQLQMEQLKSGGRKAVLFPTGTQLPPRKDMKHPGLKTLLMPKVGIFVFQSEQITPKEIKTAVKENKLPVILGAADGGMGAPDKSDIVGDPVAVVGRGENGDTAQGTLTDEANLIRTLKQTAKVTPKRGKVSVESPTVEMSKRLDSILYG